MNSGNLCYLLAHSRSLSHLLANFYVLPSFDKVQARQILSASRCLWQCMPPLYLPCSQLGKPSVFFMKWYIYLSISVSLSLSLSFYWPNYNFIHLSVYLSVMHNYYMEDEGLENLDERRVCVLMCDPWEIYFYIATCQSLPHSTHICMSIPIRTVMLYLLLSIEQSLIIWTCVEYVARTVLNMITINVT